MKSYDQHGILAPSWGGSEFLFKVEGFFLNKREYFGAEKYNVAKQNYLG